MPEELDTTQSLPSHTPSDPPVPPPSSSQPGDHLSSEPVTLESLADAIRGMRESRTEEQERLHRLELENAELRGRMQAGGQQAPQQWAFKTPEEYQLALQNYQLQGQLLDRESQEFAQLRQIDAVTRAEYNRFLQSRHEEERAEQQRRLDRATFLATRRIDPQSELARYVEVLHENDVPFEQIEHQILSPQQELARLRGQDQSQQRTDRVLQSATQIEPGRDRFAPPPSVGQPTLTAEQFASRDLERRMERMHPDLETQMFGESEFTE